jgi:hypothetical protein
MAAGDRGLGRRDAVCAWVDGQYGIDGVYLGVEAELGKTGVRRVVERDLTESELAGLRERRTPSKPRPRTSPPSDPRDVCPLIVIISEE